MKKVGIADRFTNWALKPTRSGIELSRIMRFEHNECALVSINRTGYETEHKDCTIREIRLCSSLMDAHEPYIVVT